MLPRPRRPRAARRSAPPARAFLAAALVGSLATGCRAVADRVFRPPTVAFRGATLRGVGPEGGVVDVRLLVRNPNPYALRAERASYRLLAADSSEVGRGDAVDSLEVPARDSAVLRLPVAVSWAALARAGAAAVDAGALGGAPVAYRVVGEVRARTPVGSVPFPVDAPGRATLRAPGGLGGVLGGLLRR